MNTGIRGFVSGLLKTAVLAAVLVGVTLPVAMADDSAWIVKDRIVPLPAGASEELQKSIAAGGPPGGALGEQAVPTTDSDWLAFIAARDSARATPLETQEKTLGVSIRRGEIDGVGVYYVTPNTIAPEHANRLFVHVHGGGYTLNGGDNAVGEAAVVAGRIGIPTISIDYGMPPKQPFPAAVDDVVTVYKHLLKDHAAKSMAIGGTSAGGGLALAAVHRFQQLSLEVPGAIYAGTPWADLTGTSDTLHTHAGIDRILVSFEPMLSAMGKLYAGEHDIKDPLISPVYGDFTGFPPTYLITGTRDMLLSDTVRVHRKLRAAGVVADLNVYEGVSHADYLFVPNSPESHEVFSELDAFLRTHLE